jgi:type IV pilus assembly protein PilX
MITRAKPNSIAPQAGMVLVTSLLLLIVVTLLALGMFRSFGLDEKIAGNVREKQRALYAAETAEEYAEWYLSNGNGSTGVTCAAPVLVAPAGQVCSAPLTDFTQVPWTAGVSYLPTVTNVMDVTTAGGQGTGQGTFYNIPTYYITFLGPSPNGLGSVYQIDAVGYGATADTAAVVEATYLVQSSTRDLTGP